MNKPGLPPTGATAPSSRHAGLAALTLGAVGVVHGDIGTSPLYALREALRLAAGDGVTRAEVIGVVSLLLWALILIVTLKYVLFLLRADNRGEGGILSLLALAQNAIGRRTGVVFALGVAGAALFFGDAILTPAISVLSAVEGLELVTPVFEPYVVPTALALLALLFLAQSRGTGAIAAWFGPITALWFPAMAVAGALHIAEDPGVLAAFNPAFGLSFLGEHGMVGVLVLGAVFLAVTGADALLPISAISAAGRSRSRGSPSSSRRSRSTISARARWCCPTRPRSPTRSSCWYPAGRCPASCCSPPRRR